jgi:small-conductance mechanosensitive channel
MDVLYKHFLEALEAARLLGDSRLIQTLFLFGVFLVGRALVMRLVRKGVDDVKRHYYWNRVTSYAIGSIVALAICGVWIDGFSEIGTFLGLFSAGLAIALQSPLSNLAGWLIIVSRGPFVVGDRIEYGGHVGDVIDIEIFQTHILECGAWIHSEQSNGRMVAIPNSMVFTSSVGNFTAGFDHIWDEIPITVTFESDWEKAKRILTEIGDEVATPFSVGAEQAVKAASGRKLIFYRNFTPIVYSDIADTGVVLSLRYMTPTRSRRNANQTLCEAILRAFATEDDIDFAYATTRLFDNRTEGKPDARAQ